MKKYSVILLIFSITVNAQQKKIWDPFLDTVQRRTIQWFLDVTPKETGLTPDRWKTDWSPASIAAVGFALTTYPVAVERKLITRSEAVQRTLNTLRFFWKLPQNNEKVHTAGYKGFYYHFLKNGTGLREWNCELSTIDTGMLIAGVLFAQSYFDKNNSEEKEIRAFADSLYRRVDWKWMLVRPPLIAMGWFPDRGIHQSDWNGYNEAMILYILALGSPTHSVEKDSWKGFTEGYKWLKYYGQEFVSFGPLFGHQYSHAWIDFRGIQDDYMRKKGIDYFENGRRATLTHREYAKANPKKMKDYSENIWGLTACDGPGDTELTVDGMKRRFQGYSARGASADWTNDDGTIAPTAVGGSIPFAPEICIPALKAMKNKYGDKLWTKYGFLDAFNPTYITPSTPNGWFDHDYVGIDQGPIALMIENHRSGFVWDMMKKNPYIVKGLQRAGFSGGWLENLPKKK